MRWSFTIQLIEEESCKRGTNCACCMEVGNEVQITPYLQPQPRILCVLNCDKAAQIPQQLLSRQVYPI